MRGTQLTSTSKSRARLRVPWLTKAVFLPRGGKDAVRQFLILFVFYVAYAVARALAHGRDAVALANGRTLMHAEKRLHIYIEPWVQAKFSHWDPLLSFFNFFYLYCHLSIALWCMIWLYLRRNAVYTFFRDWFMVMNGVALVLYLLVPTAPPRLTFTSGIVDTLWLLSPVNLSAGGMSGQANPYAAVPSLHFGWALFVGLSVVMMAHRHWVRVVGALFPAVTLLSIIVTGNHWLFDALAGGLVSIGAYLLVARMATNKAETPVPVLSHRHGGV
jgi:hypothetical protein